LKIQLISFGRLKFPGYRDAANEYLKRLRPWAKCEEIELKPLSVPDKSAATRLRIQEEEAQMFLARAGQARLFLLDETGKAFSTQQWAGLVRDWESSGTDVVLGIGSSLGWAASLKKKANLLSLGPQTLSHELARVVLYEQFYRALSVLRGHPYHNEG
jgi:23S rRNA (pseudouridine1915-N3)-methyltransferase